MKNIIFALLLSSVYPSIEASEFQNDDLSFSLERELDVQHIEEESTYIVALDKKDALIFKVRGPEEPDSSALYRVRFVVKQARNTKPQRDEAGDLVEITEVSEPFQLAVQNGSFWFTRMSLSTTASDGTRSSATSYTGFGSYAAHSLMITLTSETSDDQIDILKSFILSLKFKGS